MVLTDEEFSKLSCCEKCSVRWSNFKKGVWNKETRQFCGKSKSDWGKTCLAFTIFYGVFAVFYAVCFAILARTLGTEAPSMVDMMSPIKNNPALSFEPKLFKSSTFIKISNSSKRTYIDRMESLYSEYLNKTRGLRQCSDKFPNVRSGNMPCDFDPAEFGRTCSPDNDFGFSDFKPCLMLKINRVFGWNPNDSDISRVKCQRTDTSRPCNNRDKFDAIDVNLKTKLKEGHIPISCQGQNDGDIDNLMRVKFYPEYGVPFYYFPFFNQPGFQSPAIMAQFELRPGATVMIWCKLWTGNIQHDLNDQQGSVRFEMLIDFPFDNSTWNETKF